MRRVLVALFPMALALAQPALPDGLKLLENAATAIRQSKTYQYETQIIVDLKMGDKPMKMSIDSTIQAANPDKQRVESRGQMGSVVIVANGENTITYIPAIKQYTKKASIMGKAGPLDSLGVNLRRLQKDMAGAQVARVIRDETIELDGQKLDTWMIELRLDKVDLPSPPGAQLNNAMITIWVDKKIGVARQMTLNGTMTMTQSPRPMEMMEKISFIRYKFDETIADSVFAFAPPEGAKEVADLQGTPLPAMIGKDAPTISIKSLDGKTWDSAALKDKVVLLDFWASWCAPCRQELPLVEKLASEFRAKGLIVLGVNADEDRDTVVKFLKSAKISYPIVLAADNGLVPEFQVNAFPSYVVIGKDGKVTAHQTGGAGEEKLRESLASAGLK